MWAYGTKKSHSKSLQSIEINRRNPSNGITRLNVKKPKIKSNEVLIKVKASALNYNSIWSALSFPLSPFQLINRHVQRNPSDRDHLQDFAIYGSDAAGIICDVGENVEQWKIGDEVIVHCNAVNNNDPIIQKDGMLSNSQSIWGYETNFGAFSEYTKVRSSQLIKKPKDLSWEVAGSFCLTLSTAYRMLLSDNAFRISPNDNCLIWGGSGGLGNFAIQLVNLVGANPIAVVSTEEKAEQAINLGSKIVINRKKESFGDFILENGEPNYLSWRKARKLLNSKGVEGIDYVFDHVGRETLSVSLFLLNRGGTIVTCAASSGYNAVIDLRYLWMSLKRIIGSHFANYYEAKSAANLVFSGQIKPLIYKVCPIKDLPKMADIMHKNASYGKIVFIHD